MIIHKHAENLYSFRINLPRNPLGWLNCYVIKGGPGQRNLLIDSGFNIPRCLEDLKNGMAELGLRPENTDVFFTHAHFDHLGNASNLQQMGCRLMIGRLDYEFYLSEPWVSQVQNSHKDGIPDILRDALDIRTGMPGPFTVDTLEEGEILRYGSYNLECVVTPGHTPGHICLYDAGHKLMFTGDHVLFDITPNITYIEGCDMLTDYLASLDKISAYDVELALPAHKTTGGKSFSTRVQELRRHHAARLNELQNVVDSCGHACAYEAAAHMSWSIKAKDWESFPNSQKWFATGETLAHLVYLHSHQQLNNYTTESGLSEYSPLRLDC